MTQPKEEKRTPDYWNLDYNDRIQSIPDNWVHKLTLANDRYESKRIYKDIETGDAIKVFVLNYVDPEVAGYRIAKIGNLRITYTSDLNGFDWIELEALVESTANKCTDRSSVMTAAAELLDRRCEFERELIIYVDTHAKEAVFDYTEQGEPVTLTGDLITRPFSVESVGNSVLSKMMDLSDPVRRELASMLKKYNVFNQPRVCVYVIAPNDDIDYIPHYTEPEKYIPPEGALELPSHES
jgi:hypothetical protein